MTQAVLVFHGYTMNGSFGTAAEQLLKPLQARVRVVAPDAPVTCSDEAVERFYSSTGLQRAAPPYCTWWRASDDNRVYEGWDQTLALMRRLFEEHSPVGLIGFSQGAMVASLVAALSARGELPALRFAVLVAGRVPQAETLRPLLAEPIDVKSLHVWGERDAMSARSAPALMDHFAESKRSDHVWAGAHTFPTSGAAADAIRTFIATELDA